MSQYNPLIYLISFLLVTLALFNFGPLPWETSLWVNLYLIFIWSMLVFGYVYGLNMKIRNCARKNLQLNVKKIIRYGVFFNFVTMPFAVYAYTGKLPTDISFNLSLQGEVHREFYSHIISTSDSVFRLLLSFVRATFAAFIYASIILGFKYWSKLPKKYKILVLVSVFLQVAMSLARGTDKEVVDLIIFFVVAGIVNYDKKLLKRLWKTTIYALILIMFISVFTERRNARYSFDMPECFDAGQICTNLEESRVDDVIGRNNYLGFAMFTNYLTLGYHGLSLAMELDYRPTYGLGHNPVVMRIYERLTGDMLLYENSYTHRLGDFGWSDKHFWSTLYTWIANDVSFYFVPLVLLLLGILLGLTWRQSTKYNNDPAFMVFSLLFLLLIYSPANNQLAVSLEMFATWVSWLIYWFYRVYLKK